MTPDTSSERGPARAWVRPDARAAVRRRVSAAQRARLLAAAEQLICDGDAERVTVAAVCVAARVSTRTFYAAFDDRGQCLTAVFDHATEQAAEAMVGAYRAGRSWVESMRGALAELLTFLDQRPGLARFLVVDSLTGDAALRARRSEVLAALARALEDDCPRASAGSLAAPFGGEAVVAAIASILHARLQEQPAPSLRDMSGALIGMIVLPYMDAAAARRELSSPPQLSAVQPAHGAGRGPRSRPRCAARP